MRRGVRALVLFDFDDARHGWAAFLLARISAQDFYFSLKYACIIQFLCYVSSFPTINAARHAAPILGQLVAMHVDLSAAHRFGSR